jgi:hypothetical protein
LDGIVKLLSWSPTRQVKSGPILQKITHSHLQPWLLAVLTQVFPPGVFTTPLPFFVLASPPLLVSVVVTPFPFFCDSHAFPVLEL